MGSNAVYYYAVYLLISAAIRDKFINDAIMADQGSLHIFSTELSKTVGSLLVCFGVFLNLWTLSVLGVKGMYNGINIFYSGDSFGFLMDSIVTTGPFVYLDDPQYIGTSIASLGASLYFKSVVGLKLTLIMYSVFRVSAKYVEGPHLKALYDKRITRSKTK